MRNGPYWLRDLNTWSSVGRAEVMRRGPCWKYVTGGSFESLKSHPTPSLLSAACSWLKRWPLGFPLLLQAALSPSITDSHPSGAKRQNKLFYKLFLVVGFYHSNRQTTKTCSGGRAHSGSKQGHSLSRWGSSCIADLWTVWSHCFQSGSRECTGSWVGQQNLKPLPHHDGLCPWFDHFLQQGSTSYRDPNLPKQWHQLGTSVQTRKPVGDTSHSHPSLHTERSPCLFLHSVSPK